MKRNSQPHQSHSFAQLVGKANREALKPFILEVVGAEIENLGQQLAKQQLAATGEVITSIAALKKILIVKGICTEDEFKEARFEVEDEAWGIKSTTAEAAAEGDFLRISYSAREEKEAEYDKEQRSNVSKLGKNDQLLPEISAGLVGMYAGDTKEIPFSVKNKMVNEETKQLEEVESKYVVRVTVNRVSKYPQAPKAEEPAAPEAQS